MDRALVIISVDPEVGVPLPGDTVDPQLRHYTYEVESVRVLYFVTALRTVVFVARTSPRCRPTSSSSQLTGLRRQPRRRWSRLTGSRSCALPGGGSAADTRPRRRPAYKEEPAEHDSAAGS